MEIEKIITYLMETPHNTNRAVLASMLGEGDWTKLYEYVKLTPNNMNRQVLRTLLGGNAGGSKVALVDSAIVGKAVVG